MNNPQVIDKYVARLLMISFFLPMRMQVLAVMLSCGYFVIRTAIDKSYPPSKYYILAAALGSGYLLYLLAVPFTPHDFQTVVLKYCESRTTLLVMPLVFAFISQKYKDIVISERMFFVYGSLASSVIGNLAFVYQSFIAHAILHPSHADYRIFFETFTGIHPTYTGMYLCFSVCILLLYPTPETRLRKALKIAMLYLLIVCALALMPKSPLLALAVILSHYGYRRRKKLYRYKWLLVVMSLALVAACIFIPFIGQRAGEMLSFFGIGKPSSTANNSVHIRKLIWQVNTNVAGEYWLAGVGPGRMLHVLHQRYFFYSIANGFFVGYYDPHSEYFTQLISFGIGGLLLFVAILAAHYMRAAKHQNLLYLYLLIILIATFFTESVLARQQGVIFYSVFTSLFFFCQGRKTQRSSV